MRYNRRLAATSFLTHISLDGSSSGARRNVPSTSRNANVEPNAQIENLEPAREDESRRFSPVSEQYHEYVNISGENYGASMPLCRVFDPEITGSFGEGTSAVGGEYGSERHHAVTYKKRFLQQIPDDALHGVFSGSESMASASGSRKEFQLMKLSKGHRLLGQRLVLVSPNKEIPVAVFSVIPYNKFRGDIKSFTAVRRRNTSGPGPLSSINDNMDPWSLFGMERSLEGHVSYVQLLASSKYLRNFDSNESANKHSAVARCYSHDSATYRAYPNSPPVTSDKGGDNADYDPNLLDDPELIAGKHRTLMPFKSYMISVIPYVRPADLKKELNDKFKERFPAIELTLSKLRSIKREMRKIAGPDILTTAYSYVYFELLIHRNMITKANRKLCAGASLILAAKINDVKGEQLKSLIERTEGVLRVNRRELIASEFIVLVALEFGLHVPIYYVLPHYNRLLSET